MTTIPGPGDLRHERRVPESILEECRADALALRVLADRIDAAFDEMQAINCHSDERLVRSITNKCLEFSRELRARADEIEDDNA